MNDMLVCCSGLTKSYGAKPALDHVDLQLAPGKIIGLLGPNGLRYKLKKLSSTSLR